MSIFFFATSNIFEKDSSRENLYKVINKKTNQECYLIFCFIETSVLACSHTHVHLLYAVVLLVAYISKNYLIN
jgi:hypothetical protein